ncbi:MAG: C4-dicarboxylate ABC transporter permease [Clostridia bacterium]|nr:C4-dicarboxylate ABC transporter permease [Clostridia bacterium]
MDLGLFIDGLVNILQINTLLLIIAGVIGGIMIGALPGLTATMGVALLVPFTFGLPVEQGVSMLLGIFCGAMYGGSISAILIRTPGTPSAAATLLDGYPLAQKGEAGRALSMSIFASFCGGMISFIMMVILSPQISKFALNFSAPEYFALAVFGLSIIISVSGNSVLKGIMAGVFGLMIASIGLDPVSGFPRFTFGFMNLFEGPPFIPTLIGLFAFSEVFKGVEKIVTQAKVEAKITRLLPSRADIKKCWKTIVKSSILGSFIGSIPGAGGDIAAFVGYSEAKRTSKNPENFGKGEIQGVAAAEAGNNGCTGGAMIPLLSLGVPGDAVTAVLLGAFIMQGIRPGPLLYRDHIDVVYSIFAGLMIANICLLICGLLGIRFFARIISINRNILLPVIFVLSIVGSYAMRNSLFDVWFALLFGIIGYFMQRYDFPASPILLALILGPMAESNLRRALIVSQGDYSVFITRPICAVLLFLALLSLITSTIRQLRLQKKMRQEASL